MSHLTDLHKLDNKIHAKDPWYSEKHFSFPTVHCANM